MGSHKIMYVKESPYRFIFFHIEGSLGIGSVGTCSSQCHQKPLLTLLLPFPYEHKVTFGVRAITSTFQTEGKNASQILYPFIRYHPKTPPFNFYLHLIGQKNVTGPSQFLNKAENCFSFLFWISFFFFLFIIWSFSRQVSL